MLTIKLQRVGKKNQPQFRFVLVEKTKDPYGRAKEIIGWYHPRSSQMEVKKDRLEYWIKNGVQCTETVWNLFVNEGLVKGDKRKTMKLSKKRRAKLEEKAKAEKEAEEAKKAEAEAKAAEEAEAEKPAEAEAPKEETPAEDKAEEKPAEAAKEESKEEKKEAAPAEDSKEDADKKDDSAK